ncbi:MAG: tetratricopeptide repeat protein [Verrucomicrobiales bacterium]|nr:tetratricopeptide repeat protein [Verrucomicrobiales bacterium]
MQTDRPASPVSRTKASHHTARRSRPRRSRFMPLSALFALLALALGSAGLLIPRQSELVKRLVADGRHDRALALVGEAVNGEGGAAVAPTASNLVEVLLDSADHHFDDAAVQRIDALVRITDDPAGVRQVLLDRRRILPHGLLPTLLDHLAVRAVHAGDPALAVSIYADLEALQPLNLEQTIQKVAACRFSGDPRGALESISHYLQSNRQPFSLLPEDLRMTTIALHRELNEGGKAFDLLSEEFKATLDPAQRHQLVELITTVAAQSQRLGDSLPILQDYIANTAAGRTGWRDLLGRREADPTDADFRRFGAMLAQHLEWNNQTDEAFNLYRKLAALGDRAALDRCVTVYPWIDRQEDLTDLLAALVPVSDREAYTLLLGRLLAERGDFPAAEKIYRAELAGTHARDAAVWADLGGILDAQDRFDEALTAYRTALDIAPQRHEYHVRLARLHTTLGDHPAALEHYRAIPDEAHDRKTREDYSMIAKSLDLPEDFIRAVRLKIAAEKKPEPGHFLDLADAWTSLGDTAAAEAAIREGLEKQPGSAPLQLALADLQYELGRHAEAYDLLVKADRVTDKRFASRILNLGYELGRFEDTLRIVSQLPEEWSPSERLDLASLHEETGDIEGALANYRLAEGAEADIARIEASIAHLRGDIDSAIRLQARYLDLATDADFEGWTFLGDLYRTQGKSAEADAAYQKALEDLKIQLAREAAGTKPASVATSR